MPKLLLPKTKPIFVAKLHDEVVSFIPEIFGIGIDGNDLFFEKPNDFTETEIDIVKTAIDNHDAVTAKIDADARDARINNERAKNPDTLSTINRIKRIEIILGLD